MKRRFALFFAFTMLSLAVISFMPLQADNMLSESEKKEGWKLLFDGKTMDGWRAYKGREQNGWKADKGELISIKEGVTKRSDIVTNEQYESFELKIDWKVEKGANSGIIYHSLETHDASYETGPEYQVIDDEGYIDKLEDWQKSGADYAMHPPSKITAKPVGQFNHTRIVVKGAHVEHWLNGVKVVGYEAWTPEWEKLRKEGKWKDYPDYGISKTGHIVLQDHGGGVSFKNIKIRKL